MISLLGSRSKLQTLQILSCSVLCNFPRVHPYPTTQLTPETAGHRKWPMLAGQRINLANKPRPTLLEGAGPRSVTLASDLCPWLLISLAWVLEPYWDWVILWLC